MRARGRSWGLAWMLACAVALFALSVQAAQPAASAGGEYLRQLPLAHASNARDLGGYSTADGRTVKWGLLFRSGSLAELDRADLDYLAGLELAAVTDFRSASEREQAPDRLPRQTPPIDYRVVNVNNPALDVATLGRKVLSGQLTNAELETLLDRRSYINDPALRQAWGAWLRGLAEPGGLPQLFHCTAGKDRTGFAAALALLAVGVEPDQVMADFLLSNQYLAAYIDQGVARISAQAAAPVDEALLAQVLGVSPGSLAGAIAEMEARYGSIDNYIEQGLGVDAATRQHLQELLLE